MSIVSLYLSLPLREGRGEGLAVSRAPYLLRGEKFYESFSFSATTLTPALSQRERELLLCSDRLTDLLGSDWRSRNWLSRRFRYLRWRRGRLFGLTGELGCGGG